MLWKLLICLLVFGVTRNEAQASFSAFLLYLTDGTEAPLTDECDGGQPLAEGTVIEIYWDADSDGPDTDDNLAPVGPLGANFNQFAINGMTVWGGPGGFATMTNFVYAVSQPVPARFWLRICVPGADRYWQSDVFVISGSYNEFYFGESAGSIPMTCVDAPCTGCTPPSSLTGFVGSTNLCQRVELSWNSYPEDLLVDSLVIRRGGAVVAMLDPTATEFTDFNPNINGASPYDIRARSIDGPDTCYSMPVTIATNYKKWPLTPLNVAASDDQCDQVQVTWTNPNSILTSDSFCVLENGIDVMRVARGIAGQQRVANIPATDVDMKTYTVAGWNAACEYGTPSAGTPGGANISPPIPQNVVASDTSCDGVYVTWEAVTGVLDGYRVYRNGNPIMTVDEQTTSIFDIPANSLSYSYRVNSRLGDCASNWSVADSGHRIMTEPVDEISASDDLMDKVVVTWSNVAGDVTYVVYRDDEALATVSQGETMYEDFGGELETEYTYSIEVHSICDTGFVEITDVGKRTCGNPAPPQLRILADGNDAVLSWSPVDSTMNGCAATPGAYIVYFSEISDGPYFYLAATADTTYRHVGVVQFTEMRFYRAESYAGNLGAILSIPNTGRLSREDIAKALAREQQQGR